MGGEDGVGDRLLALLRDLDPGRMTNPKLDRRLDYTEPFGDAGLMTFEQRSGYDREVLGRLYSELPRSWSGRVNGARAQSHQRYVSMTRRRFFFECVDDARWPTLLPYRFAARFAEFIDGRFDREASLIEILRAINRGEGLANPDSLGGDVALQVRQVEGGSVRSYRVFPRDHFSLERQDSAGKARFVEHSPSGLVLRYRGAGTEGAELRITLDVFEMLCRLNEGYRPTVEEMQGYYLSLAVFKNVLSSAPYQEVLLTVTGHDFYRVRRETGGRLQMSVPAEGGR
jgi:hypothetical protein